MTVFGGQEDYAQTHDRRVTRTAGVDPRDVFAQSFNKDDILYWIKHEPRFGRQAVYLDDIDPTASPPLPRISLEELRELQRAGVQHHRAADFALLDVDADGQIVPSQYAKTSRTPASTSSPGASSAPTLRKGAANAGFYYLFDPHSRA